MRPLPGLFILITPVLLAGCVNETTAPVPLPTFFHLEYLREGMFQGEPVPEKRFTLTLAGIDEIHDADGVLRQAYRVEQRAVGGDMRQDYDFYLDDSLRVIRLDVVCGFERSEIERCDSVDVQWLWRGHQAHGIGLPLMLGKESATESIRAGHVLELVADQGRGANGDLWIEVDPPGYESEAALTFFRGTYWFKPSAWVPYKVVRGTAEHGSITTLVRAEFGDRLPQISGHKLMQNEAFGPPADYSVYPGDDADLFGAGWTVRDAYATLRQDAPTVAKALREGACIYESYHLQVETERVPLLVKDRTITTIFHVIDSEGTREKWFVRWYRYGSLSPMIDTWEDTSGALDAPLACSDAALSPPMTRSMADTWKMAAPIFGDCMNQLSAWYRAYHPYSDLPDAATGWGHTNVIKTDGFCEGESGSAMSRPFMVDAHSGWMTNIRPSFEEYRVWEPGARDPEARLREP